MSTYRKEGKDVIIFATADDHKQPSTVTLPEPEPQPGLILPNGEINWNCPCLGGMATGPCGVEFREAFSCFHNSEADPKGSDCYDAFKEMHLCMAEYPQLYNRYNDDDDDEKEIGTDLDTGGSKTEPVEKGNSIPPVEDKPLEKGGIRTEPKKSSTSSDDALKVKNVNS